MNTPPSLVTAETAQAIWQAGVDAVRPPHLIQQSFQLTGDHLWICGHAVPLAGLGRIAVVGGGKGGAGMAAAVEAVFDRPTLREKLHGWINVPADCLVRLERIHLHAGRPAGVNEPTEAGAYGVEQILRIVGDLGLVDICIVLLSGGGSALLPAPRPPVTLADKLAVTRHLMRAGATIQELNCVRRHLSRIKGGGLARACRAGITIGLIISDVIGDPIEVIASGPTYPDTSRPEDALRILDRWRDESFMVPASVTELLTRGSESNQSQETCGSLEYRVYNHVIGSNGTALAAARSYAERLGFEVESLGSANAGQAEGEGALLAERCRRRRDESPPGARPVCILSGGEPVVHMVGTADREQQKGGRNQQFVLSAAHALSSVGLDRMVILSGGTDGEDGPTDAAGAWADCHTLPRASALGLDPLQYMRQYRAYTFFQNVGGLLKTGPTHTNVMDLRVALVGSLPSS